MALSVRDVFITDELARRPPKKTDYLQERCALQDLAARMADQSDKVLPRFVDLAMEMADGISAGISLYEETPAPGVFRWKYLRGMLSPFNGATTPRNHSPCGITLDQNAPVLAAHPERVYDWLAAAKIKLPEVLLVPLYLGGREPLGTLWIVADTPGHFDAGHARALTELASFVGILLCIQKSEQHLQHALEAQKTLTREMSHRLKNVFAVAQSMIRMSARGAVSTDELACTLSGRLRALATAHALVRRDFSELGQAAPASDLATVIRTVAQPHEDCAASARLSIKGPAIPCGDRAVNSLALIVHELATNAAKYGALGVDGGQVEVHWKVSRGRLTLCWTERGGPRIEAPPSALGFGTVLVESVVSQQFGGTLAKDWRPSGLAVTIELPLTTLTS